MQPTKKRALRLFLAGAFCLGGSLPAMATERDDVALTLAARKVLAADRKLAPLNLGVSVANGVATLFGAIPGADLARRAEATVQSVAGIAGVVNDLQVLSADDPVAEKSARTAEPPAAIRNLPDPVVLAPIAGEPSPIVMQDFISPDERATAKPIAGAPSLPPVLPSTATRTTTVLLEPIASMPPPRGDVKTQVHALQASDPRYAGLHVELENGIVRLTGRLKSWNDLWPFADAVSRLPGVERVIVER